MIRGNLAGDEVRVVLAVLVDNEVDEIPHGRVEEDGAHHQVERAEVPVRGQGQGQERYDDRKRVDITLGS